MELKMGSLGSTEIIIVSASLLIFLLVSYVFIRLIKKARKIE